MRDKIDLELLNRFDPNGANLVLASLRDGIAGVVGQNIGPCLGKMHWHPRATWPYAWRNPDLGFHFAPPRNDLDRFTMLDPQLAGVVTVNFDEVLAILGDGTGITPRLRGGVVCVR